eukprot:CAMPEP_0113709796 /NCGR_PEP_ID=MMETSP0038_2-20120614/29782_1 /TAXON_ID=2898 /ORGANISM="Cryptomonas paramecium" /LENGTH=143 /DNA_ID=CAMNT_0000635745 /DNA_START=8 /DNA_END=437 /DNA_ORIENTATION=- /assembly_acc=CAM_ASM_000170
MRFSKTVFSDGSESVVAQEAEWALEFICVLLLALCFFESAGREISAHQRLGIDADAAPEDLRKAYRKKSLELHPDKHPPERKAWAAREFVELGKAYELLLAVAVRRHQGAGSRPSRAGSGSGAPQPERGEPRADSSARGGDHR